MKAACYRKTEAGKVLEIRDLDQPLPKDNEVLLRVRAASVNPLDWRMKTERPGVDVAGEIVAVGKNVKQFKPGDAAFGAGKGAFAEYVCARESKLAPKPEGVSFEQAAAVPIAGMSALQALRDVARLQPGQNALINASALSDAPFGRSAGAGRALRARSIKPFGGGRWRLRRMREAEGILIMGFLSCTEPLINCERNISMPQLDHVVSRPEHST
jgi:Alcohol dehydrogenase GroES-like domain